MTIRSSVHLVVLVFLDIFSRGGESTTLPVDLESLQGFWLERVFSVGASVPDHRCHRRLQMKIKVLFRETTTSILLMESRIFTYLFIR